MSFLDLNLSNVKELKPVADMTEHLLMVKSLDVVDKKDGSGQQIKVRFTLPNQADALDIDYYVALTTENDDDKAKNVKLNRVKQLYEVLNLPLVGGFDSELANGRTCWAILSLEVPDPNSPQAQYGPKNSIRKFVKGA